MTLTVGSLFAGIGGFDLAARRVGWTTRWYSEVEPYACAVMAKHFPEAVNLGDIRTITNPPTVDVLCGGFPCQDISVAGKGVGITGARSGLWKEYARLIGEVRPRFVVIENSPMLRSRGLGVVLQDLLALGYDAEWHCVPACAVGAPHKRDRIFIVAYPHGQHKHQLLDGRGLAGSEAAAPAGSVDAGNEGGGIAVADALGAGLEGHAGDGEGRHESRWLGAEAHGPTGSTCLCGGEHPSRWWETEPDVGRVAYGVPAVVDRLRCLGNAVVPQVAEFIFRSINERLNH